MADVFISYKSDDRARVQALVEALRRAGLSVWWDRDIPASANWEASITEALENAKCVIVCWTEQSVHPTFGQKVQVEAREAQEHGKLLQVFLEAVRQPLFFRQTQALDLTGWDGGPQAGAFQQLAQAAHDVVAGKAPAAFVARKPKRGSGLGLALGLVGLALVGLAGLSRFYAAQAPDEPAIEEIAAADETTAPQQPAQREPAPQRAEPRSAPVQSSPPAVEAPPTPVYERNRASRTCGARIVAQSGVETTPIGGVQALLAQSNADCAWGALGSALSVDVELCPDSNSGLTTFTITRSSQSPNGPNLRSFAPVILSVAGPEGRFRQLASHASFDPTLNFNSPAPLENIRRIRFELAASNNFRHQICSIAVQ